MTMAARFAWGLLAIAALLAARGVYVDVREGAWVGAGVMLALLAIAYVAGRSLDEARRFFTAELGEGSLAAERKAKLARLADANVRPDMAALREATEAVVRTRGYLGRYFVAATILVGLVGTFAGLMTALGDVTPLLNGGTVSFRGLDLTFGSSLVAVVITLGLTLLNGEVVSLESAVLARLDERTAHEWGPALSPAKDAPVLAKMDALLAAFSTLSTSLERVHQAGLAEAAEKTAASLAEVTDRLIASQGDVLTRLSAAVQGAAESAAAAQTQAAERSARALDSASERIIAAHTQTAEVVAQAQARAIERNAALVEATTVRLANSLEASTELLATKHAECIERSSQALQTTAERIAAAQADSSDTIARAQRETSDQIAATHTASVKQMASALEATAAQLTSTLTRSTETLAEQQVATAAASAAQAEALATSVTALQTASEGLAPVAQKLAEELLPQMRHLAEQVALLAADARDDELDVATFSELERISSNVDELRTLLGQARQESADA